MFADSDNNEVWCLTQGTYCEGASSSWYCWDEADHSLNGATEFNLMWIPAARTG